MWQRLAKIGDEYVHIHRHSHKGDGAGARGHSNWPDEHDHKHLHEHMWDDHRNPHSHCFGARESVIPYEPKPGELIDRIKFIDPKMRRGPEQF